MQDAPRSRAIIVSAISALQYAVACNLYKSLRMLKGNERISGAVINEQGYREFINNGYIFKTISKQERGVTFFGNQLGQRRKGRFQYQRGNLSLRG